MKWETVSLGSIIDLSKGKKHDFNPKGNNRYLTIEDLHNPDNSAFTNENGTLVMESDLIIAWDGANAGKVGVGYNGVIGSTLARMRIKVMNFDSRFLFWFLVSKNELIKSQRTGATIPHVNGAALKEIQIPLPPLPIQKRIADILDAADALRKKDQELLKKYDELAQAIFIDMFGDPVKNEKVWEVKKMGDVLTIDTKTIDPNQLSDYNYIGLEHIQKETGNITSTSNGTIKSNKFKFTANHILYGKLRPYLNKVAVPNFSGICSTDIFPLLPKNDNYKEFIVSILRSKHFVENANEAAVGANLPRVNKNAILDYKTIFPKEEQILNYNKLIIEISRTKLLLLKNNSSTELLFENLIQKAFSGELVS